MEYAEKPKVKTAVPRIRVKKGAEEVKAENLETPTDDDVGVDAEPHSHNDTFGVSYTKPEGQIEINEFEYVSGAKIWIPNGGQVNFWLYHTKYAAGESVYYGFYEETEYILSVAGYDCDANVDLRDYLHGNDPAVAYKIKLPSGHPQGTIKRVIFRALVEKSNEEGAKICFHASGHIGCQVVGEKGWIEWEVSGWQPTWEELGDITYYISASRSNPTYHQYIKDYQFRLYAVRVVVVYEEDMDISLTGEVQQGQISAEVMSSRVVQKVDLTNEVVARGGWSFFDGSGDVVVEVDFNSAADEGVVYVIDVGFEIEYRAVELESGIGEVLADVDATEIEYGADIVKNLLTDSRFGGLDESWLDTGSFDETRSRHIDEGIKFCRRLDFPTELRNLLNEAAWQGLARLFFEGEKFYLKWRPLYGEEAVMTIDDEVVVSRVSQEWTGREQLGNEIAIYYNRSRKGDGNYNSCVEVRDYLSMAQGWGKVRRTLDATWVARSGDEARNLVQKIGEFLKFQLAWRHCIVRFDTSLACVNLGVADWVVVNLPREGLNNVVGEVVGVGRSGANTLSVAVDVLMVAKRPWWWDSGCYVEITPTYSYMNFWVKGKLAMRLSAGGNLEIMNDFVSEQIKDAYGTDVVNHDAATHYIHFVVDCGGGEYYEWLQIVLAGVGYRERDVKYNAEIDVWEKQDLSGETTDYYIKQDGDKVKFAVNGVDVVMEFDYTNKTLKLKGEVRERAFWK